MVQAHHAAGDNDERSAFIHREILQLGVLLVVAVAAFVLTRAVAANNRDMSLRDAAEWYRRGQQDIGAGRIDDAIDAFRRATVRNRTEKRYVLALARALALKRDEEGARSALLTLRESAPEDPEINLELARLAATRRDVTEALRFYHNALYAPWPAEQAEARRQVRLELIRFLLTYDQVGRALSELLALSTDLPDDLSHHLEVAQLFARAGDSRHALEQFQHALRLAPENADALAGAGQAAFQQAEYSLARQYLRRAPAGVGDVTRTREIVDLMLSRDPLSARIGSAERRRRLIANAAYAQERLGACQEQRSGGAPTDEALALQRESQALDEQLRRRAPLEQDTIEHGVDLIDRIERQVAQNCGPPTALDHAMMLIGRRHGADR